VFCLYDLLAVGALRAAAEYGRRVPSDLAVAGFDDSEEGAYTTPTLTTIATDKSAIAEMAVGRLAYRISGDPEVGPRKINVGFVLEPRESTVGASA
jgi:DNA-binding LacI/PurR family transcriptional regulator